MSNFQCKTLQVKGQSQDAVIRVPSDDGNRIIGVIQDSTFTKPNWCSTKHLCHKHKAIGIDQGAFYQYVEPLATLIVVKDKDTRREYRISVGDFRQFAIEDDLGWGPQLFCPARVFQVIEPNGNRPHQLALWGDNAG